MRYFKSINLFVGFILGYISPNAFHWECCYCGAYQWSKLSPYHLGGRIFSSLWCSQSYQWFSLVAEFHLIILWRLSEAHNNLILLWFNFEQLRSIILRKHAFQVHLWRKLSFSSPFFIPMIYFLFFLPEAWWCCSLRSSSRIVRIVFFSYLSI